MKKRKVNHKASSLIEAFNLTKKEKENVRKIYHNFMDILTNFELMTEIIERFEPVIETVIEKNKNNPSLLLAMAFVMVLRDTANKIDVEDIC